MSSAAAELEAGLQSILTLKPPGASGKTITSLTSLCIANIQIESVLIQKLYTHFKKAPATHKLGILYVIDSVTRKWIENAKTHHQSISSAAGDGTYAAGVYKVTELLPALMNDIIQVIPVEQKEKLKKLVSIWEVSQTFPLSLLAKFKAQLSSPSQKSTTPDGTPPRSLEAALGMIQGAPASTSAPAPLPVPAPVNTSSILAALANMAKQSAPAAPPALVAPSGLQSAAPAMPQNNLQYSSNGTQQPMAHQQTLMTTPQAVNTPNNVAQVPFQAQSFAPFGSLPPPPPPVATAPKIDPVLDQQIKLIQVLSQNGVPQDQWASILGALAQNGGLAPPPAPAPVQQPPSSMWGGSSHGDGRDRSYQDIRQPPSDDRYRRRSRSVSPPRAWNDRNDRGYDNRHRDQDSMRGDFGDNGRGRGRDNDYRQRSPARNGYDSPPTWNQGPPKEKMIDHDPSIPEGHIKVLSRTLFCGGVTSTEQELRQQFLRFGPVQSVILNREKRHAFVKMCNRHDAVEARSGMENGRNEGSKARTTRWGVGFGPRECCDYSTGTSIIPIDILTDADRKWMLTAEYGGTGGVPIKGGMVVEEPDIEIGAGVSSKAISRRGAVNQNKDSPPSRYRKPDKKVKDEIMGGYDGGRGNGAPETYGDMQSLPGFPNGFPMIPPGFFQQGR